MTDKQPSGGTESDSSDLYENRLRKLKEWQDAGQDPYAQLFNQNNHVAELLSIPTESFSESQHYQIAGRIRSRRLMGKAAFMEVEDSSGRIQIYASQKDLGNEEFDIFRSLDLGDIVGLEGFLFVTRTGQTTLHIRSFVPLAKCLRPLPVVKEADGRVFDSFHDKELRYRMRYVDLIVNPHVRETFVRRSRIVGELRHFLVERGFLEVETPMMQPIPGGAAARPFVTHHNALDQDLYLRIAPELYLKRLIVGGFERVFEINRNFRNEGISIKHNPEFTMLELYQAYGDMESMLELCQQMIAYVAKSVVGTLKVEYGEHTIDLTPPWRRISFADVIAENTGVRIEPGMDLKEARELGGKAGLEEEALADCHSIWQVAELLFDEFVEARLIQPVFVTDYPRELSPLARAWPDRPDLVQRFEPYIVGREMGNAFTELNDPEDQRERFLEQVRERESGAGEGGYMDEDYVRALEFGMPPTGGMGIGVDRLVMLLTNSPSIRDTILFPLLRPERSS
ncbi:MAG: lysine--tRNA ligase [Spirochaetales bacterium]|nr:lysine--tRNA ligase [Leptospiraceae bacterium]MCP5480312.1 lysine--tRNA ligase [Spirochaetales bacterium]